MKAVQFIADILRNHKSKIFFALGSALFFFVILFPYQDLSGWVTNKVAELTQNQVFVQFDDLGFSVIPTPGLRLDNVQLDTVQLPTLKAKALVVRPGLKTLLMRPDLTAYAAGLFGGGALTHYSAGSTIKGTDLRYQNIEANVESIDLGKVQKTLELPLSMAGKLRMELEARIDPTFANQPEGQTSINIKKLQLSPSTVPTPMGPITTPSVTFTQVTGQAQLAGSQLVIEETRLGRPEDGLFIRFKGKMGLVLQRRGMTVRPDPRNYDFSVEMRLTKKKATQLGGLGVFFQFIDRFKNTTLNGVRYAFRAQGRSFNAPPNLSALSRF